MQWLFSVGSFYFYTIFTPRRHGALWIYMVFCELHNLKNHYDIRFMKRNRESLRYEIGASGFDT